MAAPLLPVAQKQGKQGSLASFAFALHKPKAKVALRVIPPPLWGGENIRTKVALPFAFALRQSKAKGQSKAKVDEKDILYTLEFSGLI
jgi:hypothetical protein